MTKPADRPLSFFLENFDDSNWKLIDDRWISFTIAKVMGLSIGLPLLNMSARHNLMEDFDQEVTVRDFS